MGPDQSQNAMTEIALALAMAFFAIMVLAMISMGAQVAAEAAPEVPEKTVQAASLQDREDGPPSDGAVTVEAEDRIVIHWQGGFFGTDLKPLNPETVSGHDGRVILALAPGLPLNQALEVRGLIGHDNLIVSTLDDAWVQRLKRMQP